MQDKIGTETLDVMQKATNYNLWLFNNFFKEYLNGNILEIGSGVGTFTEFAKECGKLTASDINNDYLKLIGKKIKNIQVNKLDIEKFKLDHKFDSIFSLNVYEHINNDKKALKNTYEMLNKDGKFIILVPAHQILFNKMDQGLGHFRRYNKKMLLKRLNSAGFEIVNIKYANMIGAMGWFLAGVIMNKKQVPGYQVGIFSKFIAPIGMFIEKFIDPPFGLSIIAVSYKK